MNPVTFVQSAASVAALLGSMLPVGASAQRAASAAESLARVEVAFSRASKERGVRAAFLEFLAPDAIIFRDRKPVPGPPWYTAQEDGPELLEWRPTFVYVSSAGDLGVSTGPWELRAKRTDSTVAARGTYLTLWRKDGSEWRAVLDYGVRRPPAPAAADSATMTLLQGESRFAAINTRDVLALDSTLASKAARDGAASVLAASADATTRTLRWLQPPGVGASHRSSLFPSAPGVLRWTPLAAHVAKSGDLAYTYGEYEWRQPTGTSETGYYVRVFRRVGAGEWKVLLDVHRPHPPT
jgi:ketosteroid isomerase-like protein